RVPAAPTVAARAAPQVAGAGAVARRSAWHRRAWSWPAAAAAAPVTTREPAAPVATAAAQAALPAPAGRARCPSAVADSQERAPPRALAAPPGRGEGALRWDRTGRARPAARVPPAPPRAAAAVVAASSA